MPEKPPNLTITAEEMQTLFNEGGYQKRIKNEQFPRIVRKVFKPQADVLKDFGDVISVGTYCFDENGFEVVYAHHYESPAGHVLYRDKQTGTVYLDGRMDPKRILEGGVPCAPPTGEFSRRI